MSKHAWLTSDALPDDDFICRRLRIPNTLLAVANVNGALLSLCEPQNWELFGAATIEETVAAMTKMYDEYSLGEPCLIASIILYATESTPQGTLPCDGATYNRVDYPELYAALNSIYIIDADTFVTPNPPSFVGLNYFIVAR
jgi:hypothetical protein